MTTAGFHRYLRRWALTQIEMNQDYVFPEPFLDPLFGLEKTEEEVWKSLV